MSERLEMQLLLSPPVLRHVVVQPPGAGAFVEILAAGPACGGRGAAQGTELLTEGKILEGELGSGS